MGPHHGGWGIRDEVPSWGMGDEGWGMGDGVIGRISGNNTCALHEEKRIKCTQGGSCDYHHGMQSLVTMERNESLLMTLHAIVTLSSC